MLIKKKRNRAFVLPNNIIDQYECTQLSVL